MNRTTARLPGLTAALLAGGLVLAGCSGDAGHEGMAGMSGSSSADSSPGGSEEPAEFADADVAFAQGMLPHHEQAVEMSRLTAGRSADPRVADLASRIQAAQGPEIETLTGWLEDWGAGAGSGAMDHGSSDHGAMDGMMSEQDVQALSDASGAAFDRMFLELMVAHHRGATAMAETELAEGKNPDALAMAEDIRDSQNAEIAEMEKVLSELGG